MNDVDKQYAYWLACRGCGIKRAARLDKPPSKRSSRAQGRGPRQQRARQFKWAFMTGGNNPPLRHKFGLP